MSGGGLVSALTGGLAGGSSSPKIKVTAPEDTAQQETDSAQKINNAAISRKKSRSLLSTGASSNDTGGAGVAQAAKKLLGE